MLRLQARGRTLAWAALWVALALPVPHAHADEASALVVQKRGWDALSQARWLAAEFEFEHAIALDPKLADPWLGLGHALFWQERYREAELAFARSNELDPARPRGYGGIAHCELSLATRSWHPPAERRAMLLHARDLFARALALDPHDKEAREGSHFVEGALARAGAPPLGLELLIVSALLGLCALLWRGVRRAGAAQVGSSLLAALRAVLPAFVLSRALVLACFWFSPRVLSEVAPHPISVLASSPSPLLRAVAQRWDSNLYAAIALEGYRRAPDFPGLWGSLGQFPLLPIAYRASMYLIGDAHLAALILPHLALLVACVLLFLLVEPVHGTTLAARSVALLLFLPGSLFGSVLYAEAFALLFMLGSQFALTQGSPLACFLSGLLAGMTRVNAIAVIPLLAWELRRQRARPRAWLALLGPIAGACAFMLYTQLAFGDAFAYVHELRAHRFAGQGLVVAFDDARRGLAHAHGTRALFALRAVLGLGAACMLAYAAAAVALYRRAELGAALCIAAGLSFALGSSLAAQPRYLWLSFPACPVFAQWTAAPLRRVLAALVLASVLALEAIAYAAWYYVT